MPINDAKTKEKVYEFYAIFTYDGDDVFSGSIKETFTTFEEAKKNAYKYAHYGHEKGDVLIKKYKLNNAFSAHQCHEWHIKNNNIVSEYDWSKI